MFTPELADGFIVVSIVTAASCILTPVLCWMLVNHASAVDRAQATRQAA